MLKKLFSLITSNNFFFSFAWCLAVLSGSGPLIFEDTSFPLRSMSTSECCSSSPRFSFHRFVREIKWVNEDFPEVNAALLEGLKCGFRGYTVDKIIKAAPKRSYFKLKGHDSARPNSDWCNDKCDDHFKYAEQIIFGTTVLGQVPGSPTTNSSATNPQTHGPLKRSGTLTVRPTIGQERKAWILEARKAYCLEELQRRCAPPNTSSSIFYRDLRHHHHHHHLHHHPESAYNLDNTSMSCPDLWAKSSLIELDVKGVTSQASIRLSPRMEKLDKLMPKASKEFLNTFRVVSTISPQNSDEQLISPEHDKPNSGSRMGPCHRKVVDISSRSELIKSEEDESPSSSNAEAGSKKRVLMLGRSYKEVCLFGHSSAPPTARVCSSGVRQQEKALLPDYKSSQCFPSLTAKKKPSGSFLGEDDKHKSSPPLYSSILQRSPTKSPSSCGESCSSDSKGSKDSKPCYDCGFCRTNNEPESVYRSHPLRVNGVVICPTLRKYVCCFCGATGDKAHTIKYCPENPIGFFAKKVRHHGSEKGDLNNNNNTVCSNCAQKRSPEKKEEDILLHRSPPSNSSQLLESSYSDSESQSGGQMDDHLPFSSVSSQDQWIEAKPKGRKKKNAK